MNCEILSTLYVRSNGDIPCDDDEGEKIILANASAADWSIVSTFRNPSYRHIHQSFNAGQVPWPKICPTCSFYRPNQPFSESISRREIQKFQVEPSLACNLSCPCCSQLQQIMHRPKPFVMKPHVFEGILREIRRENFAVREIEYCGQGDPLMNHEFPAFVSLARKYLPGARQRLITNGNFDYAKATGQQAIDEIFVSCDGVRQNSYVQYRVRGDVHRALTFLRAIPKKLNGRTQLVVWKYILFEFNDSDDEIREAQAIAQDLGVDVLLFVHTHSQFKSQRFTPSNAGSFPIYYPNVRLNATPRHYQQSAPPLKPVIAWRRPGVHRRTGTLFMIDEVTLVNGALTVKGWFLCRKKIDRVIIRVNGRVIGPAEIGRWRFDVYQAFPKYEQRNGGYTFTATIAEALSNRLEITAELIEGAQSVAGFSKSYVV